VFTSVSTSAATQRELAEKYGVDRTTIRSICATAKQCALAAAVPGRRSTTGPEIELADAYAQIERLKATICEQADCLRTPHPQEFNNPAHRRPLSTGPRPSNRAPSAQPDPSTPANTAVMSLPRTTSVPQNKGNSPDTPGWIMLSSFRQ